MSFKRLEIFIPLLLFWFILLSIFALPVLAQNVTQSISSQATLTQTTNRTLAYAPDEVIYVAVGGTGQGHLCAVHKAPPVSDPVFGTPATQTRVVRTECRLIGR